MGGRTAVQMGGRTAVQMGGVLQYKWEVYCRVSLSSKLRSQESSAIQMGGVLPYKLEVYCRTFWTSCRGWGFRNIAHNSLFVEISCEFSPGKTRCFRDPAVVIYYRRSVFGSFATTVVHYYDRTIFSMAGSLGWCTSNFGTRLGFPGCFPERRKLTN